MTLFAPTTGSTIAGGSEVNVVGSEKAAIWFGITSDDGPFGASAIIYDDTGCAISDRQIAYLFASACTMSPIYGPYISSCGAYVGNIEGGSVTVWVRPVSRT